ncbi:MAG: hypothetical protein P8Q36_13220 [Alphaproteobacteria bacterium]|jgi:hypothetical protein|nr:hypothetical protein [Rhodospirillaceae bacterium]MBT6202801.1 hypothetical protein [Rhodospirillaceae bacterium]MBT7614991.1 hypothetical protein [Rhodospirillaceae bacterium]MDG2481809.1 hypothetical protein [Alphaproteobacteria bacterium]
MSDPTPYLPDVWLGPDGEPVSCVDKLKLLQENLEELHEMAQEALEDAVVMGCDETQARKVLSDLVASLEKPFA